MNIKQMFFSLLQFIQIHFSFQGFFWRIIPITFNGDPTNSNTNTNFLFY